MITSAGVILLRSFDKETGTYYLRARYYNDPLGLNLYTYCANNPILFIDPNDHEYGWIRTFSIDYNEKIKCGADTAVVTWYYDLDGNLVGGIDFYGNRYGNTTRYLCSFKLDNPESAIIVSENQRPENLYD